ncbi:hypothetical protein FRB96_001870 [Tulasnella sp. 330]|nr:hypothetical protein FRB96_001870 [Tulasnella sp. 330]
MPVDPRSPMRNYNANHHDRTTPSVSPPATMNNSNPRPRATEDEKRKSFLERNRQAAFKCRQRKKAWHSDLQRRVEHLTAENDKLRSTIVSMRDEVARLSSIVVAHRSCGLGGVVVPGYGGGGGGNGLYNTSSSPSSPDHTIHTQLDNLVSFLGEEGDADADEMDMSLGSLRINTKNLAARGGGGGGGSQHIPPMLLMSSSPMGYGSMDPSVPPISVSVSVSPMQLNAARVGMQGPVRSDVRGGAEPRGGGGGGGYGY